MQVYLLKTCDKLIVCFYCIFRNYSMEKKNLVEMLRHAKVWHKNAYLIIAKFGTTRWETLSRPMIRLTEEENVALLLNWLNRANRSWFKVLPISIRNEEDKQKYVFWFSKPAKPTERVEKIKRCVHNDVLYDWPEELTYNKLKTQNIISSVCRKCFFVKDEKKIIITELWKL